mmetsp:Transcript_9135/g.25096  ORF Transcript_9135/g.25096 Transcript_9135/m.25096 type:complete len:327 (+) Transcript_9135:322-1302(+)
MAHTTRARSKLTRPAARTTSRSRSLRLSLALPPPSCSPTLDSNAALPLLLGEPSASCAVDGPEQSSSGASSLSVASPSHRDEGAAAAQEGGLMTLVRERSKAAAGEGGATTRPSSCHVCVRCFSTTSAAMKVPLRPTPALQCTMMGPALPERAASPPLPALVAESEPVAPTAPPALAGVPPPTPPCPRERAALAAARVRTRRMRCAMPVVSSGTPWSGHAMHWYWYTTRGALLWNMGLASCAAVEAGLASDRCDVAEPPRERGLASAGCAWHSTTNLRATMPWPARSSSPMAVTISWPSKKVCTLLLLSRRAPSSMAAGLKATWRG